MAYVSPNFPTKKTLKEALQRNLPISVYQPGIGEVPKNGSISIEGPHYPQPHRWYAEDTMKNGKLIKVK